MDSKGPEQAAHLHGDLDLHYLLTESFVSLSLFSPITYQKIMMRVFQQIMRHFPARKIYRKKIQYPLTYTYLCQCYISARHHHNELSSSLYVSEKTGKISGNFHNDINLGEKLKDIESLKKNLKLRGIDLDVEKLV